MEANVRFDHQLLAVEGEHEVHCMLELAAPAAAQSDRPALHLALVVDRSGSMHGRKLAAARDCARFLVSRLQPSDELALVTFDDEVELLAPLGPADVGRLVPAVESIAEGGSTNLSGGWLKGLEELNRATGDGVRRVLLLTDGQANQGIVEPDRLVKIATGTKQRAATTTIGFGDGFDEELLTAIAESSDGNTYFAETPEDAPGIFAEEFEGLAALVAQNVSVEIRPTEQVGLLGVLNDYPTTEVPGGVQLQIGDAYGGEHRRLVFALHIPQLAALGPARVADVVLRYVSVGAEVNAHEVTIPVTVNLVSADEAAAAEIDHEVTEEVWLLDAARARKDAIRAADEGDLFTANSILRSTADQLRSAGVDAARADEMLAEADRLDVHASTVQTDDPMWRKRIRSEQWRTSRGRRDR
jgi:Ca-activated chloride channel family protein